MTKALTLPLFDYAGVAVEDKPKPAAVSGRGAWEIAQHQRSWIASYRRAITHLAGQQAADIVAQEWHGDTLVAEMLFWRRHLSEAQERCIAQLGGA